MMARPSTPAPPEQGARDREERILLAQALRPRAVLVGAALEENLSIRSLAAAAREVGIATELVTFNDADERDRVCRETLGHAPFVVGISTPFQARAGELLGLAAALRGRGYAGHITVGGHFPTLEYENVLRDQPAVDSVVRHEGSTPSVSCACACCEARRSLVSRAW
jgi:anaerobic magnesium-protoporphyrin IX monomethyl ester cyclase